MIGDLPTAAAELAEAEGADEAAAAVGIAGAGERGPCAVVLPARASVCLSFLEAGLA